MFTRARTQGVRWLIATNVHRHPNFLSFCATITYGTHIPQRLVFGTLHRACAHMSAHVKRIGVSVTGFKKTRACQQSHGHCVASNSRAHNQLCFVLYKPILGHARTHNSAAGHFHKVHSATIGTVFLVMGGNVRIENYALSLPGRVGCRGWGAGGDISLRKKKKLYFASAFFFPRKARKHVYQA